MTETFTELAPLAAAEDRELQEAVGRFGADVLGSFGAQRVKAWHSPTDKKDYSHPANGKKQLTPADVLSHLRGEKIVAAAPIQRAIVIDHDLSVVQSGDEAPQDAKDAALQAVTLLLDTFALPHVHFDGARGVHTWIRLDRNPTPDELAALRALLNGPERHPQLAAVAGNFEVWPNGQKALRLPLGRYIGQPRHAVPTMRTDAYLAWLTSPERATDDQLAALLAAAPSKPVTAHRPQPVEPPETIYTRELPPAPAPLTGWENWPDCKRAVALTGPGPHKRHDTLLSQACEAVESGERNPDRLVAFLAAIPRPHSQTSATEHAADVRAAARGALELHADNDHRRFSGCPHVPQHSGHPQGITHRQTFEHECTPERAARCPIHKRWERAQNLPAYNHILASSIWRSGRGHGAGLGYEAKEVYKLMLRLSGGDPERVIQATQRYIAIRLSNLVREQAARQIRRRLINHGLIEAVNEETGHYRVPFRPASWISALEAELGTDRLARNEERSIRRHWHENERLSLR